MSPHESVALALEAFPMTVELDDGREVELRAAAENDQDAILHFANALPESDLLFLRVDITQPAVVANWLRNISMGETVTLLAVDEHGEVCGYATVDRNSARWTRRVGEIRVNVAPAYRSHGLGRHLTARIFDIARKLGLKKLTAHMTPDQSGAHAAFTRLGFRPEALLADYIEDRHGRVHDLAILSYDIDGLTSQMDDPLRV